MIKTVLFDLDDTLLDFHKAEAQALRKALEQLGLEPGRRRWICTALSMPGCGGGLNAGRLRGSR